MGKYRGLYLFSLSLFFWSLFDGIISYITPLFLVQNGLTETMMGLIISTSSIAGAIFDFLLARYLKNAHYRRLYMVMFAICFLFPLFLWKAKIVYLAIIAMSVWGLYYDLMNFGLFDFISRKLDKTQFSAGFGVVGVFKSLGYILGPVIAGLAIGQIIGFLPFLLSLIFLLIAFVIFLLLLWQSKKNNPPALVDSPSIKNSFLKEIVVWKKIGWTIIPILIFSMILNITDAFFWTIGPLFAESLKELHPLGGLFVTVYMLPSLLIGWFTGVFTNHLGKKRTGYWAFLLSSIFLILLYFAKTPIIILLLILFFAIFSALSWPAVRAVYSDFIRETLKVEKEITGLEDFFSNIGYILGPVLAGVLADLVGNQNAFVVLGIIGTLVSLILIKITPKSITVKI